MPFPFTYSTPKTSWTIRRGRTQRGQATFLVKLQPSLQNLAGEKSCLSPSPVSKDPCLTCGINSCNGSILWIAQNVLVLPRIVDCRLFAAPAGNRFVLSRVLFVLSAVAPLGRPSPWLTAPAIVVDLAGSHHRLLIALFPPMPMKGCWREPFTSSNIASAYRWLVRSPT